MKTTNYLLLLLAGLAFTITTQAQSRAGVDSTGLPGDNFSLQGALDMFKKASSPEAFEKLINTEDNSVNNLDLDGDGETDYISVIDRVENDAHAFVLQVAVSETEKQDVAVIELEKTGDNTAIVQIIGDEDLYGEQVIVEPDGGEGDNSYIGDGTSLVKGPYAADPFVEGQRVIVNVWIWPSVRFVFGGVYRPWISPWRWHYYPGWYRPWRPLAWHAYHPRVHRYYRPYVVVHTHRVVRAHKVYTPVRVSSTTVRTKNAVAINNYRVSRTKTTVTGPRGHSVTKQTTTVRKNGKVKGRTTRVRRGK